MNKFWSAFAVSVFAGISIAGAQTVIYAPEMSVTDQHISLRGWGSGTIAQTDEAAFEGTNSIRVSSRNFFQGGIMTFGNPVNLATLFDDKSNMLRITIFVPDSGTTMGGKGGAAPGQPGNSGGGGKVGGGAIGGGGGKVGGGSIGGGGQAGAPGTGASPGTGPGNNSGTPAEQPPLSEIRMIITTSDGKKSEAYVPIATSGKGERGWKQVAIPVAAIRGLDRTNKMISEMWFAGNSSASFYIGDMRVINDTTPITGEANIDRTNMALGDEATLTAYGYGGSSVLKFEWDFDSDGKADAEGQYVKHRFRKDGDFTVTLTVSDVYGLKKPYTSQIKIHVNP